MSGALFGGHCGAAAQLAIDGSKGAVELLMVGLKVGVRVRVRVRVRVGAVELARGRPYPLRIDS